MLNLNNIVVVSLEQAVAAPYCSCRLADAGARVIKIEREEGDFARYYDAVVNGESAYFVWLNRGKESLVLNVKDQEDIELLYRLLAEADVFIQNLAPGAAARAGLGSQTLRARYPQLICCDISGYGEHGDYRDMKAYDLLVQCESGLASITGTPEAPGRVGVSICDIACGQQAYTAILEALIERENSGEGSTVQVSLFDSMAEWMAVPLLHYDYGGKVQRRVGLNHANIVPYGAYASADGHSVVIAVQNNREWRRFCETVLERPDLAEDERFRRNADRVANRAAMDAIIQSVFGSLEQAAVVQRLQAAAIAYGKLNDVAQLAKHPQLRRQAVQTPSGTAELVSPAPQRSSRSAHFNPVPALGEQSDAIRQEFAGNANQRNTS